jgi:hypothetical protein
MVDPTPDTTTTTEPTYLDVAEELGWSPDQLRPPLDLAAIIEASYHHVALVQRRALVHP